MVYNLPVHFAAGRFSLGGTGGSLARMMSMTISRSWIRFGHYLPNPISTHPPLASISIG
jgi:hypothetical protein